jgi:hypothetical protein
MHSVDVNCTVSATVDAVLKRLYPVELRLDDVELKVISSASCVILFGICVVAHQQVRRNRAVLPSCSREYGRYFLAVTGRLDSRQISNAKQDPC